MAKKPETGIKNSTKPAKAAGTSVRKETGNKKQFLSKPVKSKADKPKPDKKKSMSSKSISATTNPTEVIRSSKSGTGLKTKTPPGDPALPSVLDYQEQRARIARRAYELWEERCPPNGDVLDWLRAEHEIMGKS